MPTHFNPPPVPPPAPPKQTNVMLIVVLVIVGVVLFSMVLAGIFAWNAMKFFSLEREVSPDVPTPPSLDINWPPSKPNPAEAVPGTGMSDTSPVEFAFSADAQSYTLSLPSSKIPSERLGIDLLPLEKQSKRREGNYAIRNLFGGSNNTAFVLFEDYLLGTVKGGAYDGLNLRMQVGQVNDLGGGPVYFYYIDNNGSTILLPQYGGVTSLWFQEKPNLNPDVLIDTHLTIQELEQYPYVDLTDTQGRTYTRAYVGPRYTTINDFILEDHAVVAQTKEGPLYAFGAEGPFLSMFGTGNTFFTLTADGRALVYDLKIPFWKYTLEGTEDSSNKLYVNTPAITWNDGTKNTKEYRKAGMGGCGFGQPTDVVPDPGIYGQLVEGGYFVDDNNTKVSIFVPKSFETEAGLAPYESMKAYGDEQTLTKEDYLKSHPLFFHKDSLGRLVRFTSMDFIPPAECGKPVIYLYPEKTTDMTVMLAPQGGFTKSEPSYADGWRVTAHPDGSILNKDDGKTYPYLFWEGRGGSYSEPQKFWVVKREDVRPFLTSTLATLGLNKQETTDFLEFWAPRMEAAPYYKIGFHGTSVMNQIAPLSISTKPQTLLRILMDYQELEKPITPNPPTLPKTPIRRGFTVIEWGGVIR
ncbi:hypothetical protein HYV73_00990 [Candidatus Uhrbacteria bacterium]|nr:hypothetical protein [Candidatus Uhrbacteria bacterium]